jgi:hypothetical protein
MSARLARPTFTTRTGESPPSLPSACDKIVTQMLLRGRDWYRSLRPMKSRHYILATVVAAIGAMPGALHAQTITQWNFNNSTTTPSTGTGILSLVGGVTSTFNTGSPEDTGSPNEALQTTAYPASTAGSGTAGVEYAVSTVGFAGSIQISLDFRQSGTASRFFQLELSTDGSTFSAPTTGIGAFGTVNSPNTATSFSNGGLYSDNAGTGSQTFVEGISYTLPAGSPYANNANFAFEFVSVFDPSNGTSYTAAGPTSTYATTGNTRFDEVTVGQVPEPSAAVAALAGIFGLAICTRRRTAKKD